LPIFYPIPTQIYETRDKNVKVQSVTVDRGIVADLFADSQVYGAGQVGYMNYGGFPPAGRPVKSAEEKRKKQTPARQR
jgi:hypothetical protein